MQAIARLVLSLVVLVVLVLAGALLLPFILLLLVGAALYLTWKIRRLTRPLRQAAQAAAPREETPAAAEDCVDIEFKTIKEEPRKLR